MTKLFFQSLLGIAILFSFSSCIGDDIIEDFIEPEVRIMNAPDSIEVNTSYQFEAAFFNNIGQQTSDTISWMSSDPAIISIDENGLATALQVGDAIISASATLADGTDYLDERMVAVGNNTVIPAMERTGSLQTTSSYTLTGDFILEEENGTLTLSLSSNYAASSSLPGLYVYLTNNPNTTSGAFEIGKVTTFSGAHSYSLPSSVSLNDYEYVLYFCKPFNVKVGDGQFDD